jgi:hypothetical protein
MLGFARKALNPTYTIDRRPHQAGFEMNQLQTALEEIRTKALADFDLEEAQIDGLMGEVGQAVVPELAEYLLAGLRRDAPRMLREYRRLDGGFRRRNLKRWCGVIHLLEMMWVISMEIGAEFLEEAKGSKNENKAHALIHLHARALLITREIICLIQGGYADGALSRWRSLHEVAVTAFFLSQHGEEIAERYIASFDFAALQAAEQLNRYAARANLTPIDDQQLAEMRERRDELAARFSKDMTNYGWASPVVSNTTFAAIEEAVQLDHWRPRYKWGSQHTHAGYRPQGTMLGLSETFEDIYLVGASNSGFTDPLQMTAISLVLATHSMLLLRPKLDYLVVIRILESLSDEIGPLAETLERGTLETARRAGDGGPLGHLWRFLRERWSPIRRLG